MKRFLAVLILIFAASFAHADTINLMTNSNYTVSDIYTFPAGSAYNWDYGTGVGLIIGEVYGNTFSSYMEWEGYSGTTVGHVTHFSYAYLYSSTFGNLDAFNATWNAKTDVFSMFFLEGGKKWHLTATSGPSGSYINNLPYYTDTSSSLTQAQIATVPEPGSLWLMGTGLLSLGGFARRRFLS
jgi:hypothetical protein